MLNPDIKILRDGPAKIIAGIRKRDSLIDDLTRILEEKDRKITEMVMMIDSLERHLTMYENTYAPPHNSAPVQQKKKCYAGTITSNGTTDTTNRKHVAN